MRDIIREERQLLFSEQLTCWTKTTYNPVAHFAPQTCFSLGSEHREPGKQGERLCVPLCEDKLKHLVTIRQTTENKETTAKLKFLR